MVKAGSRLAVPHLVSSFISVLLCVPSKITPEQVSLGQYTFALRKAWLSALPEREPLKKPRDLDQARSVAKLVVEDMSHLSFENTLTSLHGDVRKMLPMSTP